MSDYWDSIIEDAGNESLAEFSDKASSLTKLTNKEIEEAIPDGIDHAKFAELMQIVNDAAKSNEEKAKAIRETVGFSEIAANLLIKLV